MSRGGKLENTINKIVVESEEPSLVNKINAALFVITHGEDGVGIGTKATVMWPVRVFSDGDLLRECSKLVGSVHTALLEALPLQSREQILKDQAQRLSRLR